MPTHDNTTGIKPSAENLAATAAESEPSPHESPSWNNPARGTTAAVLLGVDGVRVVEISHTTPAPDVARLVGSPLLNQIRHVSGATFWVGDNSQNDAPFNPGATQLVNLLLCDVRDGRYTASDRAHVRNLLARPDATPVIYGPCLITGTDDIGHPGPLDEAFRTWFTALYTDAIRIRAEAIVAALVIPGRPDNSGAV